MSLTIPNWRPPVTSGSTLDGQSSISDQLETVAAVSTPIPIAYGEVMLGGRIFAATYSGGTWYVGALFCLGEIDEFVSITLDDAAAVAGVSVNSYRGTTSQTADPLLAAALSGYTDTLVITTPQGSVGVAYCVIAYTDAHYSGLPSIKARIKGRKVLPAGGDNRLIYSQQLDNTTGWTQTGNADIDVTADAVVAPDGTTTADKLIEASTATAVRYIRQTISPALPDAVDVCVSGYFKAAENSMVRLVFLNKAAVANAFIVNLSTGVISGIAGASLRTYGVRNVGDGWWRCYVVANTDTGATACQARVQLTASNGVVSYAGTIGNGIYAWGLQLELGTEPGPYVATGATTPVRAWSDNPALCLRDLITDPVCGLGEPVQEYYAAAAVAECDALVIAQKRRRFGMALDRAQDASQWIDTLSTYAGCWTTKRGQSWVLTTDRPAHLWQFSNSLQGWTALAGTLTAGATYLTTEAITDGARIRSAYTLRICGARDYRVRARFRRASGTGAWQGIAYFATAWHGETTNFRQQLTDPGVANGTWQIAEWDMRALFEGGADWPESLITRVRLDLYAGADNVVDVDWVSVGVAPVSASNVVAGSLRAVVADTLQAPTVVTVRYTDTAPTPWREREAQVALPGVALGTVLPRESAVSLPGVQHYAQAVREATERLNKLQRTTQAELTLFDEGLYLERGDVVSILHPFLGTASAAECDDSTLYRVIDDPRIAKLGRVGVRLIAYGEGDYDNTEAVAPWSNVPGTLGGMIIGRSGDGVNRMPSRFAGGWSQIDSHGQIPVTRGADVQFCGIGAGNGSSTGPTAGYYGTYSLKINSDAAGTDRGVWFGSSATDYNIPLDPNSSWLFRCKFWPTAANIAVEARLKSSAGTTYTLTDSTSTSQTWNDFVHTANGANTFDLSADASDRGLFGLSIGTSAQYVWFDGLMLEKRVSNGAIVSPWRPPVASNTNGARVSPRQVAPGVLDDSVTVDDGADNARSIARGIISGLALDGDVITFEPPFLTAPTVIFQPGGLTNYTAYSTDYALVCEARGLTESGFTAAIKIRQVVGTITARTDSSPTDQGVDVFPRYTIQKSQAAQAWDDRYTFQFDVTVMNQGSGEPSPLYYPGFVEVGLYVALSSGVWTLVSTTRVSGATGSASSTSRLNRTAQIQIDGLGQHAGPEFGIAIVSQLVPGGSIGFDNVKYGTAGAPTETSATAGGVSPVPYMVIAG